MNPKTSQQPDAAMPAALFNSLNQTTMIAKTIEYKGYHIIILQDTDAPDPLTEFDTFGEISCFHRRYNLTTAGGYTDQDELRKYLQSDKVEAMPLYLYDHSGISISTAPFSCPWDSGMVGYIHVDHEKIIQEYGKLNISHARNVMSAEISTLNDYLTGNVWGYECIKDGQHIDSCWGFYGDYETSGIIGEAKAVIDCKIKANIRKHSQRLKHLIKSKVPLIYRQPALY